MSHMILATVFGMIGATLGLMIPVIAEKIISFKNSQKNYNFSSKPQYKALFFVLSIGIFNTLVWFLAAFKMENFFVAIFLSILFTTSVLIAIIDLQIRIIPNELVMVMLIIGLLFQVQLSGVKSLLSALLSMIVMIFLFAISAGIVGFGKVGAGDIKLSAAMGLALGFPHIITALIVMSIALFVYCIVGISTKRLTMNSMFPLAPFMMSGMIVKLVYMIFSL